MAEEKTAAAIENATSTKTIVVMVGVFKAFKERVATVIGATTAARAAIVTEAITTAEKRIAITAARVFGENNATGFKKKKKHV